MLDIAKRFRHFKEFDRSFLGKRKSDKRADLHNVILRWRTLLPVKQEETAAQIRLVLIPVFPDIEQQIKKITCNGDIYGLNACPFL